MSTKKYVFSIIALAIICSFVLVIPALAENNRGEGDSNRMNPNVVGKVSAVSGDIITVVSNKGQNNATSATFMVNAANAKILRGETVITISDVAIGDNVVVQGTVTGNNVVAATIRDGKVGNGNDEQNDNNQALLQIKGNGQPIVAGTVTAVNASMLTITNSANVVYTVDATNAKVTQGKDNIALLNVKVGDAIIVQGSVNGTAIVASTIIDQAKIAKEKNGKENQPKKRFFGSMGQWFRRLFGF